MTTGAKSEPASRAKAALTQWTALVKRCWGYCAGGVWNDTRRRFSVNTVKTVNLSVRSFLNSDVQSQACAMTYRTLLAIVPALALLFAIGRGFGFQNAIENELFNALPAQKTAIAYAINFVDSYLNQASEGIFVGVGVALLLWTLISLVSNVERTFNKIWNIKEGRSLWRKITDYTAMLMILPVLMICASGLTLMLSNTLRAILDFDFLTPLISVIIECSSWIFTWLFFTAVYKLIPNTKVKFGNALLAGAIAGTGFMILQWLFVSGQLYVSRYNAIYGSFAFVPLLLLWMQLTWMLTLSGAALCYSSQNIFRYSFDTEIAGISESYNTKIILATAAVIVQRFCRRESATTLAMLVDDYGLPPQLATAITDDLVKARVISRVVIDMKHGLTGFQPALEPELITVGLVRKSLDDIGNKDFIPDFAATFAGIETLCDSIAGHIDPYMSTLRLDSVKITHPAKTSHTPSDPADDIF